MKTRAILAILAAPLALVSCVAPIGPVEVTRFHEPASIDRLGQGTIAIQTGPGFEDAEQSLEFGTYRAAVARELQGLGYDYVDSEDTTQLAEIRVERSAFRPGRDGGPVTVGGGASTGSYGSGVGVGIGIDLSGPPPEQVSTSLGVRIRDRASGATLWEGRADFTVRADSPLAGTQLGAPKLAAALFRNFPGNNGETVEVP